MEEGICMKCYEKYSYIGLDVGYCVSCLDNMEDYKSSLMKGGNEHEKS